MDANSSHSSIVFDGLINFEAAKYLTGNFINDYSNLAFFEITDNDNLNGIEKACKEIFIQEFASSEQSEVRKRLSLQLIPLKDSYFATGEAFDPMKHGNKTLVRIILGIGILILVLAIVNYVNLFFAGSFKRHKELAIKNINGSQKENLSLQIMFEGIIICTIAWLFSILLSGLTIPWFNQMIDYSLDTKDIYSLYFICSSLLLAVLTGLLSGIFPAFMVRSIYPIHLLKGSSAKVSKYHIWKYLVLFQMVISIFLIIGTLIITRQVNYSMKKDMGYKTVNVVTLPVWKLSGKMDSFLQLVENYSQTESWTLSSTYLNTFNNWGGQISEKGQTREISYYVIHANANFLNTTGISLAIGRNFVREDSMDINSCIINQATVNKYNLIDPLSAKINDKQIIGVVKDFHIQSIRFPISPIVIYNAPVKMTGMASIRFRANSISNLNSYMTFLKTSWEKLAPDLPFEFEFLDERIAKMYETDSKLMKAFISFSSLAIFIACLGIFGIITFISETHIKEIGIRRVNGAKTLEVMNMLTLGILKWVAIAFVIACPIAWYAMHKWLENFAYKTELNWWVFAAAGGIAMVIALLTVSFQSWRAATRNPVESLRYE